MGRPSSATAPLREQSVTSVRSRASVTPSATAGSSQSNGVIDLRHLDDNAPVPVVVKAEENKPMITHDGRAIPLPPNGFPSTPPKTPSHRIQSASPFSSFSVPRVPSATPQRPTPSSPSPSPSMRRQLVQTGGVTAGRSGSVASATSARGAAAAGARNASAGPSASRVGQVIGRLISMIDEEEGENRGERELSEESGRDSVMGSDYGGLVQPTQFMERPRTGAGVGLGGNNGRNKNGVLGVGVGDSSGGRRRFEGPRVKIGHEVTAIGGERFCMDLYTLIPWDVLAKRQNMTEEETQELYYSMKMSFMSRVEEGVVEDPRKRKGASQGDAMIIE